MAKFARVSEASVALKEAALTAPTTVNVDPKLVAPTTVRVEPMLAAPSTTSVLLRLAAPVTSKVEAKLVAPATFRTEPSEVLPAMSKVTSRLAAWKTEAPLHTTGQKPPCGSTKPEPAVHFTVIVKEPVVLFLRT